MLIIGIVQVGDERDENPRWKYKTSTHQLNINKKKRKDYHNRVGIHAVFFETLTALNI